MEDAHNPSAEHTFDVYRIETHDTPFEHMFELVGAGD